MIDIQNMDDLLASIFNFIPKLAAATAILLSFWILARILCRGVKRFGMTRRLSPDVVNLMVQITETGLLIFGIVSALGTLGINVGAMIAGLGLVGFALGFALRDLLSNFLAGFLILIYNPFIRGDKIEVGPNSGTVVEVNMRYTVLSNDERRILIPNATLFSSPVIVHKQAIDTQGKSETLRL